MKRLILLGAYILSFTLWPVVVAVGVFMLFCGLFMDDAIADDLADTFSEENI